MERPGRQVRSPTSRVLSRLEQRTTTISPASILRTSFEKRFQSSTDETPINRESTNLSLKDIVEPLGLVPSGQSLEQNPESKHSYETDPVAQQSTEQLFYRIPIETDEDCFCFACISLSKVSFDRTDDSNSIIAKAKRFFTEGDVERFLISPWRETHEGATKNKGLVQETGRVQQMANDFLRAFFSQETMLRKYNDLTQQLKSKSADFPSLESEDLLKRVLEECQKLGYPSYKLSLFTQKPTTDDIKNHSTTQHKLPPGLQALFDQKIALEINPQTETIEGIDAETAQELIAFIQTHQPTDQDRRKKPATEEVSISEKNTPDIEPEKTGNSSSTTKKAPVIKTSSRQLQREASLRNRIIEWLQDPTIPEKERVNILREIPNMNLTELTQLNTSIYEQIQQERSLQGQREAKKEIDLKAELTQQIMEVIRSFVDRQISEGQTEKESWKKILRLLLSNTTTPNELKHLLNQLQKNKDEKAK